MQMDVRDMSFFPDESFDSIIDKGRDLSFHYMLYQYLRSVKVIFFGFVDDILSLPWHLHSADPRTRNSWFFDGMMGIEMFSLFLKFIVWHTLIHSFVVVISSVALMLQLVQLKC